MELRKAERKRAKLRIGIQGASGSGKTYSALRMAHGLVGDWKKIAVIDTENGSAELYSDLGDYSVLTLKAPFSPARYCQAIKACDKTGIDLIIVDSVSHEWEGEGGCLDIHAKKGGQYINWKDVTPKHRLFLNAILQSPKHVIATERSKTAYDYFKDDKKGKYQVQKMGTKGVQRDGYEYELTINFILNDEHWAKADKDRTNLFASADPFLITEETGKILKNWNEEAKTGEGKTELKPTELEPEEKDPNKVMMPISLDKATGTWKFGAIEHQTTGKLVWFMGFMAKQNNYPDSRFLRAKKAVETVLNQNEAS